MKVLVVDDEPHARRYIRSLLEEDGSFEVLGECADGDEALDVLRETRPDVVFLDIQMPGLDGFGVVEALGAEGLPRIVFVTAHDHYALKAFEVGAVDYVLKPVEPDRFQATLRRVKGMANPPGYGERILQLLSELRGVRTPAARFVVKDGSRAVFVKAEDLEWVESCRNHVCLHTRTECHLLRQTMGSMEQSLDSRRFTRIHRCHIVKLDAIRELQTDAHGEWEVTLRDGTRLPVGRSYRSRIPGL